MKSFFCPTSGKIYSSFLSSPALLTAVNAYIFDLDGTLVESLPGIAASLNRAMTAHGLPGHSDEAVRSFIGNGAQKLVERSLTGVRRTDLIESVLRFFAADYGVSWPDGTFVYEGIPDLLADLRRREIPLAVLSNKPHTFTLDIVTRLFPAGTFSVILGKRDDLPHKPDPTGALEIASQLGIPAEQCTIIGDSTMDLETATNAGMKSIAVTWGYHDREHLHNADQIVDTVAELTTALS